MHIKDKSTKVGGRRNSIGNDYTAGNSVGNGMDDSRNNRSFASSKSQAVAKQNTRFKKTRTRRGERDAV